MASSWVVQVGVGAAVVIVVVGSLIWLGKKGYFTPDSTNEETREQRAQHQDDIGTREFSIPLRKRAKTLSGPAKAFFGALALLLVGLLIATYQIMRTGSPYQQWITAEVQYALVATLGIIGGVRLERWFRRQIGHLYVVYQRRGQDNEVEKIPYRRDQERRTSGSPVVDEVARNRMLGLFWRFRQVGEDRRLRSGEKPLSDIIGHKIPDHGNELPDGGYIVETREDGDEILAGASAVADVTYASPHSLSDPRATQIREEKRRKDAELQAIKATNAALYDQIRKMRKKINNEEYRDRQAFMEDLEEFSRHLRAFRAQVDINDDTKENGSVTENGQQEADA